MIGFALAILLVPTFALAQNVARTSPGPSKPFPDADFVLHDKDLKPQKNGIVLGPMHSDGKGGTTGTFAIYGGGLPIEVSSMSFSGDGKLLAVGSTPGIVDLWDVEGKKKLRLFKRRYGCRLKPGRAHSCNRWQGHRGIRRCLRQTERENSEDTKKGLKMLSTASRSALTAFCSMSLQTETRIWFMKSRLDG